MQPTRGSTGGMLPADREDALWAEVRRIVEAAGLTYKAAQVKPRSVASLTGEDGWTMEVVWMPAGMAVAGPDDHRGNWKRDWYSGANAVEVMAKFRAAFVPAAPAITDGKVTVAPGPRILNLSALGAGGVKPRPWGPFDLPPDVIDVSRNSTYGNPYHIGYADPNDPDAGPLTRDRAIALFEVWAEARLAEKPDWLDPLKGKRLACWCAPLRCHAEWYVRKLEARGW